MTKLTKCLALALIAICTASFCGELYGAFHGHDSDEPTCDCSGCSHAAVPTDSNAPEAPSSTIDLEDCRICSSMAGLLKPWELETTVDDDGFRGPIPPESVAGSVLLRASPRVEILSDPDPLLASPHLRYLSSVIIRC